MNRNFIARELLAVAKELTAGGMKRMLEDISVEMGLDGEITEAVMKEAQKRMKKVKVKKGALDLTLEQEVENRIRDELSGTLRATKENLMFNSLRRLFKGLDRRMFRKIWNGLVKEKYLLENPDGTYSWEM